MRHAEAHATPERAPIASRRVEFDFDRIDGPYWYRENVVATAFLGALSAVFPPGEKEFVRSVMHYRDRITDDALRSDIRGFAAQEGSHSNQHRRANEWLDRNGYGASAITAKVEAFNADFAERFPPQVHLAVTVVMEHITAILAEYVLTHPERMAEMPPAVRAMFEWHAAEEIEHKAVAFDVYDQVVGDRDLLRLVCLVGTASFVYYSLMDTRTALRGAPRAPTLRDLVETGELLFARRGIFASIGRRYLDFYRRDFHPWMHDNQHLVARWAEGGHPAAA